MKKINFLFVVLMVASLFVPVWADSYDITTNYYTYYESHDSDYWFSDVAATEDGGYIAVGGVIVKYDSNHEVEWKKEGGYDEKVIVTSDGGYVTIESSYINKYDSDGNKVWEKEKDATAIKFVDVVEYNDSYLVVATMKSSDEVMVVKYDSDGNKTGSVEYDYGFNTIEVTSDGGYVLAGNGVIKKYDSSGNEELSIDSVDYEVNDIKQTSDGGYIAVGDYYGDSSIVKYDSEGKEEWWYINQDDDIVYNSVSMNDNSYIAVGNIVIDGGYDEGDDYNATYAVYDNEGNLLKSDSLSGDEDTYFGGVDTLNNGSYVIAGYLEADDLYEIKLNGDCDGLILNVITPVSGQSETTSSATAETKTETSNYLIWIIVIVVIVILVLVYYNKKKKTKSDKIKKNEK